MTIKVQANPNANAVNFIGSSNPTFWNAHLEGEVNSDDNTRINVINKISGTDDSPIYEFWAIPFEQILDRDGNSFSSADSAAAYITADSDFYGDWFDSGIVDLSCAEGTVNFAFKYVGGGDSDIDGSYEIDNIRIAN